MCSLLLSDHAVLWYRPPFGNVAVCPADSMSWQSWSEGSIKAPALTAHTLTAVGQHGILCFGGQGKKTYNAVHKLDPATCLWSQFKTIGVRASVPYAVQVHACIAALAYACSMHCCCCCSMTCCACSPKPSFFTSPHCQLSLQHMLLQHAMLCISVYTNLHHFSALSACPTVSTQ